MSEPGNPIDRFNAEVADLRLKSARTGSERLIVLVSLVIMVAGLILAAVSYATSLNMTATPGSNVDLLSATSYEILAILGVGLSVVAGLVFLRYSLAQFLRFWLLRQSYEQQAAIAASRNAAAMADAPDSNVTTPDAHG